MTNEDLLLWAYPHYNLSQQIRIEKILYPEDCSLMTNGYKRIFTNRLMRDDLSISKIFLEYLSLLCLTIAKYVNVSMCVNE